MGNDKDLQRDQKKPPPQAGQPQQGGRKNDEEVGEPIQLDDDKSQKQGSQPPGGDTANC